MLQGLQVLPLYRQGGLQDFLLHQVQSYNAFCLSTETNQLKFKYISQLQLMTSLNVTCDFFKCL